MCYIIFVKDLETSKEGIGLLNKQEHCTCNTGHWDGSGKEGTFDNYLIPNTKINFRWIKKYAFKNDITF